jgi:transcriptional regulator with XRE-family HTH domain
MVPTDILGRRVRALRTERDWSGPEAAARIAAQLGQPFAWDELRRIEQGTVAIDEIRVAAIAATYDADVRVLLAPPTAEELNPAPAAPPREPDRRPPQLIKRSPYRPGRTAERSEAWDLRPGDQIRRTELHDRYGGSRQGGIAPCRDTPNVLIFTDPAVGHEHGYYDQWEDDDVFLYYGEGQVGDQQLDRGNRAILDHRKNGKALRVFEGSSGVVRYAGEFAIAYGRAYEWGRAPSTGGGPMRRVVIFRLVPVD